MIIAHGVRRVLPDRVGPDPVRARAGDPRRARAAARPPARSCRTALRITDLDPLRYGLLFERFLNPERIADARHRHGLRRAPARRGDPLRDRDATAPTTSRRSSRSRRSRASRASATPPGSWASRRSSATGSARCIRRAVMGRDDPIDTRARALPRAARGLREGARGQGDRRHGARARGSPPGGLGARGRRRDRRRPARELPAAEAHEGLARRREEDRHAVRHARRRGARAAEDGLPGPAQPLGDRGHAPPPPRAGASSSTSTTCRSTTT